jgi:hypothetical protein
MADINVSDYVDRYYAAIDRVSLVKREGIEFHRGQAIAYIWGRMDGGDRIDPSLGDAFSWAYATVIALFTLELLTNHGSIQSSWDSFVKNNGAILDYNGRRIDTLPVTAIKSEVSEQ